MSRHPTDLIGAYVDGELPPEDMARIRAHLAECSECARELALIRAIGEAMRETKNAPRRGGVWEGVHRGITRPVGWLLFLAGVVVWAALAVYEWFSRGEITLEWLATTAIVIGLALLLVGIAHEQYTEWRDTPYKDIER